MAVPTRYRGGGGSKLRFPTAMVRPRGKFLSNSSGLIDARSTLYPCISVRVVELSPKRPFFSVSGRARVARARKLARVSAKTLLFSTDYILVPRSPSALDGDCAPRIAPDSVQPTCRRINHGFRRISPCGRAFLGPDGGPTRPHHLPHNAF